MGELGGCTSLYFVHDPQSGLITAGQIPGFLKSIRCELVTFYEIERRRKTAYADLEKISPPQAFAQYAYFDVEPTLYGTYTTELKVTDSSAALAGATGFDFKQIISATATATDHVAPSISTQATDDLIWSFLIRQDAELTSTDHASDPLQRGCYTGPHLQLPELELFADGQSAYAPKFTRILVNGKKPMAAWLRDNGALLSANYLSTASKADSADPSQMTYTFTIQIITGLEGKYSLVATHYSPTVEASGSLQQNSILTIWINGPGAVTANAAKTGGAAIVPVAALGSKRNPMYVYTEQRPKEAAPPAEHGKERKKFRVFRRDEAPSVEGPHIKGYLLVPPTVTPPMATPNP